GRGELSGAQRARRGDEVAEEVGLDPVERRAMDQEHEGEQGGGGGGEEQGRPRRRCVCRRRGRRGAPAARAGGWRLRARGGPRRLPQRGLPETPLAAPGATASIESPRSRVK